MKFVDKVKKALSLAGVDCTAYSGHSFRIGAAITVVKQGINIVLHLHVHIYTSDS